MFHIFSRNSKTILKCYLPELDGHKIYFQVFGNPNGKPILNFHGGPGAKSKFKYVKSILALLYAMYMPVQLEYRNLVYFPL